MTGRRILLMATFASAAAPLVSAIPAATTLRALFVTSQGEAYVDLSAEVLAAHPGGATNELLTIYTVVHALALNLPAIAAVQLLVDGREVDTLAGHVDLRRPLAKDPAWLAEPVRATPTTAGPEPAANDQERGPSDAIR